MHRTYLADIEGGKRNVTLRSISNLAQALQLTVEGLLFHTSGAGGLLGAVEGAAEILLVEDNPADVELTLRAFLHPRISNPVRVVGNGEEALEYVFRTGRFAQRSSHAPQLVLLDLSLPTISGPEVLRRLQANQETRSIPVVILTASRDDANIMECSRLGATNYIIKPFEFAGFARATAQLDFSWTLTSAAGAGRAAPA